MLDKSVIMENRTFFHDLTESPMIIAKCKDISYARKLYAALCNNQFVKDDVVEILRDQTWSCSWRAAGSIVADIRGQGDYMDYYCQSYFNDDLTNENYPEEGTVTEEIRKDIQELGYLINKY